MIKVFFGEDRVRAQMAVKNFLGDDYEVVDGVDLKAADLPSLLKGGSLFADERAILIRDLGENREVFEKLAEYLDTSHKVALFETKLDKRSGAYKMLKDKIEWQEFVRPKDKNEGLVFEIYRTAKQDGRRAVEIIDQIKDKQEPMMFVGLMVSQTLRDYQVRPNGIKEKRVLKELSKLDMQLKSTKLKPWVLISAFLLRLSSW